MFNEGISAETTIIKRLNELANLINKHNFHYHNKDKPLITDREYDNLVKENIELESKFPHLKLKSSPNNKIGTKIQNKLLKSNHLSPMYSLSNAFNEDDLIEFDERIKKFISKNVSEKEKRFISGLLSDPKIQDIAILAARHSASADGFHILEKKKFDYWVKFWDL